MHTVKRAASDLLVEYQGPDVVLTIQTTWVNKLLWCGHSDGDKKRIRQVRRKCEANRRKVQVERTSWSQRAGFAKKNAKQIHAIGNFELSKAGRGHATSNFEGEAPNPSKTIWPSPPQKAQEEVSIRLHPDGAA